MGGLTTPTHADARARTHGDQLTTEMVTMEALKQLPLIAELINPGMNLLETTFLTLTHLYTSFFLSFSFPSLFSFMFISCLL